MTDVAADLVGIYRYPVKGLSPQPLQRVTVAAGETLPFDRAYAIENGPSRFDPFAPRHLPKVAFLMLMRDERLATLETDFDTETATLTISRAGRQVCRGQLSTPIGRKIVEQFLAAYMKDSLRGPPKVLSAEGHSFSDVAAKRVHIVNLATLRELERAVGRPVNPLRFRPNLVIDGPPAWAEFDWIGRRLRGPAASLTVRKRTDRCAATNVDPATGARDMDIPAVLGRRWGHTDLGVYAEVTADGELAVGDRLVLIPSTETAAGG